MSEQIEHLGAPKTITKTTTADFDIIAAPGAGHKVLIGTAHCDVDVAEAGKFMSIVCDSVIIAKFSLAAVGSFSKYFNPPFECNANKKVSLDTTGTTGSAHIVIGYYKSTN